RLVDSDLVAPLLLIVGDLEVLALRRPQEDDDIGHGPVLDFPRRIRGFALEAVVLVLMGLHLWLEVLRLGRRAVERDLALERGGILAFDSGRPARACGCRRGRGRFAAAAARPWLVHA